MCIRDRAYDLSAACSGFVYAITAGAQFIEPGAHRRVMVIGADKMSMLLDFTDRTTCVLFGDGAGGGILERSEEGAAGLLDVALYADGSSVDCLYVKAGGSRAPATHQTVDAREHYVRQEGATVFKFALSKMAEVSVSLIERNGLTGTDLKLKYVLGSSAVDTPVSLFGLGTAVGLAEEGLDRIVLKELALPQATTRTMDTWETLVSCIQHPKDKVTIHVVGKYVGYEDSYKSLNEALYHAGFAHHLKVSINWVEAEALELDGGEALLDGAHGILVPGGFGSRGSRGMMRAAEIARTRQIPYFGICYGFQWAAVEYARHVCNLNAVSYTHLTLPTKA